MADAQRHLTSLSVSVLDNKVAYPLFFPYLPYLPLIFSNSIMKISAGYFADELFGRVILIALSYVAATSVWWSPLVVVPIFWQVWDRIFGRAARIDSPGFKLIADGLTYLVWLSYMGYAIVSMGRNIGHWYGWTLGFVVGIGVAHLFGLLFPYRWHLEVMDRRMT